MPLVSLGKRFKKIRAVVLDELPGRISTPGLRSVYQMLQDKGFKTADVISSDYISDIELMIGCDHFADFVGGVSRFEGVDLFETPGGFIPFGKIPCKFSSNLNTSIKTNVVVCRLTANISPLHVSEAIDEELLSAIENNVNMAIPSSERPRPPEPFIETHPQRANRTRATLERRELIKGGVPFI